MLEQIKFIHFEEISSTQDYAQQLIEKKLLTQPCLIYTDYQTKGRGQLQKQWHGTPQKNIYMTLAIPCNIHYQKQFHLSLMSMLSCLQILQNELLDKENLKIKWPNDIYYQNKKLGGLLIENRIRGKTIYYTLIGIGLNINEDEATCNQFEATSLFCIHKKQYNIFDLISNWVDNFSSLWTMTQDFKLFDQALLSLNKHLYKKNQTIILINNDQPQQAKVVCINKEGCLELELKTGKKIEISAEKYNLIWK